jgi:hypothetical protein
LKGEVVMKKFFKESMLGCKVRINTNRPQDILRGTELKNGDVGIVIGVSYYDPDVLVMFENHKELHSGGFGIRGYYLDVETDKNVWWINQDEIEFVDFKELDVWEKGLVVFDQLAKDIKEVE